MVLYRQRIKKRGLVDKTFTRKTDSTPLVYVFPAQKNCFQTHNHRRRHHLLDQDRLPLNSAPSIRCMFPSRMSIQDSIHPSNSYIWPLHTPGTHGQPARLLPYLDSCGVA